MQANGVSVKAAANPGGVSSDSAYVASVIEETPGPVIAVGHSYGGAVISNAATLAKNVVGLVYVAAFAPDKGETLGEATAASKDAVLGTALVPQHYLSANGGEPAVEFVLDPAQAHDAFAADLPAEDAALIGVTQRPVAELAFSERSGAPAWEGLALLGHHPLGRQGGRYGCPALDGGARQLQGH